MTVALVTGAGGLLGGVIVRALLEDGQRPRALVRRTTLGVDGLNVEIVSGSITNLPSLHMAMAGADVVYHCAGLVDPSGRPNPLLTKVNVEGTRLVLKAARTAGVRRVVHVSSTHALTHRRDVGMDESAPLALGAYPYAKSKAEAEVAVLDAVKSGQDAVIINPSGIIGPYDAGPSQTGQLLLDLARRRLPGLVKGGYHWVDVRDVARGALLAAESGVCGERYILTTAWHALSEIGKMAGEVTGVRPPAVFPWWMARAAAPAMARGAQAIGRQPALSAEALRTLKLNPEISSAKARSVLGWQPRPVSDAIRDAYAWFEERGMLARKRAKRARLRPWAR